MTTAAVIPARGGSKRIPRKNIRRFAGKPIIAHSIDCARQSGLFDRVVVSTDDEEIARVAVDCGAEVPFLRPPGLADDHTGTTEVVAHAVEWLRNDGVALAAVCCIYATAPFIRQRDLARGLSMLQTGGWQYVFAATHFAASIFRAFHTDAEGGIKMYFPECFNTRSQDLREALQDAGQFYWGLPQAWLDGARIFDKHSTVVHIPKWCVQDIDTEEDWVRAEAMAAHLKSQLVDAPDTQSD